MLQELAVYAVLVAFLWLIYRTFANAWKAEQDYQAQDARRQALRHKLRTGELTASPARAERLRTAGLIAAAVLVILWATAQGIPLQQTALALVVVALVGRWIRRRYQVWSDRKWLAHHVVTPTRAEHPETHPATTDVPTGR